MRKTLYLMALASSAIWAAESADIGFALSSSLPPAFWENLRASDTHEGYSLSARLNPFYLQGDFNGDGQVDIAILAEQRSTGKPGILIVHMGTGQQFVLGAGNPIGNGGDDFSWMDAWYVREFGIVTQSAHEEDGPPVLVGDALMVIKTEAASGLVYWTGSEYEWYQRGD